MAKTSKTAPQKETPSSSRPAIEAEETASHAAVDEPVPEPPLNVHPRGTLSERQFQGLSKDVELKPPVSGEDFLAESTVPRQVEEKNRKRAPSSPSSDKKKTRRRLASVLHHETFLRYRDELNQLEAEVRELTEKRDTYKFLSEQREGEAKSLRAELEVAQKEHADLVEQVQQKIDQINQLRAEMDAVKVEAEKWRGTMDCLTLEKETTQAQLTSAEVQLRATREKAEAWSQKIEELKSQLSSVVSDRETLSKELKAAKSVVKVTKDDVDEMVAQYKANAEAAQDRPKYIVEYVKWQSRREALEEVHARGFDFSVEVENAKGLEAERTKKTPMVSATRRAPVEIKPSKYRMP
uniref:Coiled-coil domain-containing protein 186-like n=1 Tax=Nicotiana tabacum TaxID=4097 RepID=A0A1S3ZMV7_TOBAC|nr:PREDICTED: coiled-coil domain-containing protein 186-like [Nicotiana tabacum]